MTLLELRDDLQRIANAYLSCAYKPGDPRRSTPQEMVEKLLGRVTELTGECGSRHEANLNLVPLGPVLSGPDDFLATAPVPPGPGNLLPVRRVTLADVFAALPPGYSLTIKAPDKPGDQA